MLTCILHLGGGVQEGWLVGLLHPTQAPPKGAANVVILWFLT